MRLPTRTARLVAPVLLCLLLTGCVPTAQSAGGGGGAGTDASQHTVIDAAGTKVELPVQPQRVVVVNDALLDAALALGVTPIAMSHGQGQDAVANYILGANPLFADAPITGPVDEPDVDVVRDLEPDLILVGATMDDDAQAELEAIAPTFVAVDPADRSWKSTLEHTAAGLNRLTEHEEWLEGYEERVATAVSALAEHAGDEVTLARWTTAGPAFLAKDAFASEVLAELGLDRPANQQERSTGDGESFSPQTLDALDSDRIFLSTFSATGEEAAALDDATRSDTFNRLEAIEAGRWTVTDGSAWAGAGGPLAALVVIDDVLLAYAD